MSPYRMAALTIAAAPIRAGRRDCPATPQPANTPSIMLTAGGLNQISRSDIDQQRMPWLPVMPRSVRSQSIRWSQSNR